MWKFKNIVWIGGKQVEESMCDIKQTKKVRIMGVFDWWTKKSSTTVQYESHYVELAVSL
jgi:hypothetical protein